MDASAEFLKQGILGAIVIVLASVIVYLFKLLMAEKDKRLSDALEDSQKYREVIGEFSRTSELTLAKLEGKEKP